MAIKGKSWGNTEDLLTNQQVEIHRVKIRAGAQCSQHRHAARYNAFYVLKGSMWLRVWRAGAGKGPYDAILLKAGDCATVEPGEWHQFEANTHVEALEIYYPAPVSASDIERR